jgi:hypothetical protein
LEGGDVTSTCKARIARALRELQQAGLEQGQGDR